MQYRPDIEGFREVHENISEMIEQLANDPSVGLYYVQQHVRNAAPNLHRIKSQIADTTQEITICTEDLKDAIHSVKLMKGCGPLIIDEMVQKLKSSVALISTSRQHKGKKQKSKLPTQMIFSTRDSKVFTTLGSAFQSASKATWGSYNTDVKQNISTTNSAVTNQIINKNAENLSNEEVGTSTAFVQSVFKSAFQRAGSLGWYGSGSDVDTQAITRPEERFSNEGEYEENIGLTSDSRVVVSQADAAVLNGVNRINSAEDGAVDKNRQEHADLLPVSSNVFPDSPDAQVPEGVEGDSLAQSVNHLPESKVDFEQFQAERAAKFEAWLHEEEDDSNS